MVSEQDLWVGLSSRDLAAVCRQGIEDPGKSKGPSRVFLDRGTIEELEIGIEYCRSADPLDRCTGPLLLGHLGYDNGLCAFPNEVREALVPLLDDPDERVIKAVLDALWCLNDAATAPRVEEFLTHPNADIRYAATFAFNEILDGGPVWDAWMLRLAKDPDCRVRYWATHSLSLSDYGNSPVIRQILVEALHDSDGAVRAMAFEELAMREDPRMVEPLLEVFRSHESDGSELMGWWSEFDPDGDILEAIAGFSDLRLAHVVEALLGSRGGDIPAAIREKIEAAHKERRK